MPTTHVLVEWVTKNTLQSFKHLTLAMRKRLVCPVQINALQGEDQTCGKMLDTEHHVRKL